MRWVWRADFGAAKAEYAAVVLLVAVVTTAVLAAGLPTDVRALYDRALCEVVGTDDCSHLAADDGEPGDDGAGADDPGTTASPHESAPPESPAPSTGEDDGAYDPALTEAFYEAQGEQNAAQTELDTAEQELADLGPDETWDELLNLLGDIVGINDAKACLTEGDLMACLWTIVGLSPFGKGAKLLSKAPKILKLWNRWRKGNRTREAIQERIDSARDRIGRAETRVDDALSACGGSRRNSFVAGTPVLMADGSTVPIQDVDVGDLVLAFDPVTGEEGPRAVTHLVQRDGPRTQVDVTVVDADGTAGELTTTDEHPFWVPDTATWTPAADLTPGTWLRTSAGTWAQVTEVDARDGVDERLYNFSVDGLSTYYALAGAVPLLTHNEKPNPGDSCRLPDRYGFEDLITDDNGLLRGRTGSRGVQEVTPDEIQELEQNLRNRLGEPTSVKNVPGKGTVDVWETPNGNINIRDFSSSGGVGDLTIDFSGFDGLPVKRFHAK